MKINFKDSFMRLPIDIFIKAAVQQNKELYPYEVAKYIKDNYDVRKGFVAVEARMMTTPEVEENEKKRGQ